MANALMTALFGDDGIGGKPGLVGKAGNAVWNGTGDLPEGAGFLDTLGNSLGNIPHMLTDIAVKNPLEILKNPASALNSRGEVSITRLLFPDFRREADKQAKQEAKVNDAIASAKVVNAYDGILKSIFEAPGAQGDAGVQQAIGMGVPQDQAERAAAQDIGTDMQQQDVEQQAVQLGIPAGAAPYVQPEQLPGLSMRKSGIDNEGRRLTLAEARERRLGMAPPPKSPEAKADDRRTERAANRVFDTTATQVEQGLPPLIEGGITDPGLRGSLKAKVPQFAVQEGQKAADQVLGVSKRRFGQTKREAKKIVREQIPLTSRKNIVARREAEAAIDSALPQDIGMDSPILDDSPLPSDPATRMVMAETLAEKLLAAGFPPEKVVVELLRKGFTDEEIPE